MHIYEQDSDAVAGLQLLQLRITLLKNSLSSGKGVRVGGSISSKVRCDDSGSARSARSHEEENRIPQTRALVSRSDMKPGIPPHASAVPNPAAFVHSARCDRTDVVPPDIRGGRQRRCHEEDFTAESVNRAFSTLS